MNVVEKIRELFRPQLTCEDVNSFIVHYIEGELDPDVQASFLAHIGGCSDCMAFLSQYETAVDLCRTDGKISVPPELAEKTLAFLREHL